ncbi:MAG: asparaginase [Oscillospiraceae bacterium]
MRKILLITTGGTIACPDTDENRSPESGAKRLLEQLGVLPENVEITSISPFCRDSTDMSPREWTQLAVLVRDNFRQFDGFVITHGTDTLGYAAAALSCLIQNSEKPVVLTGSMLPMSAENSDAPRNLKNAILFAADTRACGVCVVFGKFAFDGRHVSKIHSIARNAFESVNFPPIACFDERGITFTEPIFSFSGAARFYQLLDESVEVIFLIPGISPPLIRSETRAVIILGFGTGGLPMYGGWEKWLETLISRGVYVIMSTQVLRGGSNLRLYEVGNRLAEKYPIIDAGKMTSEYAALRAMFALAYSRDFGEFKRIFLER